MTKDIRKLKNNWEGLAKIDPLWAILTDSEKKEGKWDTEDFFNTGVKEIEDLMTTLNRRKILFNKSLALDFGCGVGRLTQPLAEYFDRVIGVDLSSQMIRLAENFNSRANCEFVSNSSGDLAIFHNNSFDFIYSNIVLQHITPDITFAYLSEFIRILKKDGLLIFQLPDSFLNPFLEFLRNNYLSQRYFYRLYLFAKFGFKPVIETYGIKKKKVVNHLEKMEFIILNIDENRNAGPKWISYMYIARKN